MIRQTFKYFVIFLLTFLAIFGIQNATAQTTPKSAFFLRFKIVQPTENKFKVIIGGFRHKGGTTWSDWVLKNTTVDAESGIWTNWIDLTDYNWHEKLNRAGGIAEFPSLKLTAHPFNSAKPLGNYIYEVQLADAPDEKNALISFTEKSESNIVGFLAPYPLRENFKEFETGSQMIARHYQWAMEATKGKPIKLKKFDAITQFWGQYDPALERQDIATLKQLGFSAIGNVNPTLARINGIKTYGNTWLYRPDPEYVSVNWKNAVNGLDLKSEDGKWKYETMPHWVISDEVSGIDLDSNSLSPEKPQKWFRDYLRGKGLTDKDLGKPIDQIEYPAKAMYEPTLPHNAPLETRKIMYHAGKFGQWWSARQLRQINDLIKQTFPKTQTEILLPSHGFLGNAWYAYNIGYSYRMLDIFEVAKQQSVTQFSTEDWIGLNRMYWSEYTWTGGQTFAYLNALTRSAIGENPIMMRGLLTVSDEKYLRLKAFSSLGQGTKSFFYWTYGPTYVGTENYWSDLRGMYDGIAKVHRDLEKAEDILHPAKTVTDAVAILYAVSHDLWHTNNQAAFVEKRLLWHALRHLQIQPNFVREEEVEEGNLKNYKVLYITDRCLTRKASEAIDKWVKAGGVLYLAAGAATRDEFYEPFTPPFAEEVWGKNAAQNLVNEQHQFNERTDLPKIKPLTTVSVNLNQQKFDLPVIGSRLNLLENGKKFATFADGKTAGTMTNYGNGKIIAVGFMPMLAYGQLANFKPSTLEEKWTPEPRAIIKFPLDEAEIVPVIETNVPVVETSFLQGNEGSVIVLANYTYQPIKDLTIDLQISKPFKKAVSIEGKKVKVQKINGKVRVQLPLEWTDMILLKN
jgi:hypothetical protein